jgi:hypothetical protein
LTDRERLVVEATARRVVELLAAGAPLSGSLVDAAEVARALGVARRFVYRHAVQLGGQKVGGVWRFDLQRAIRCCGGERSEGENPSAGGRSRSRRRSRAAGMPNGLPEPGAILRSRSAA